MPTVTFQNGKSVTFDKTPSPQDIDFVAQKMGINVSNQSSTPDTSTITPVSNDSSIGGIIKNTITGLPSAALRVGGAIGNALTSSEQAFGQDIAGGASVVLPESWTGVGNMKKSQQDYVKSISDTITSIKDKRAKGQDTTSDINFLKSLNGNAPEVWEDLYPALKKTNLQVLGDAGGVLLDTALTGSYGAAAESAKAGQLLVKEGSTGAKIATKLGVPAVEQVTAPVVENAVKTTLAQKATNFGVDTAKGAGIGYGYDVVNNVQQGKSGTEALTPGVGTATGAATPLIGAALKGSANLASEALGLSTGVGGGAIKEAFNATAQGGESGSSFRNALRGNTSAEDIVGSAKGALSDIIDQRSTDYKKQLETLKGAKKTFDTSPVQKKFDTTLSNFGVGVDDKGALDFSRAPGLGRYEGDVRKVAAVLNDWGSKPGDRTIVGIDKLKQVLDDFRVGSQDSKKFDSFVTTLRNEAQGIIINEPGYKEMVNNYTNTTGVIKDIQKGLSLGDKASTDTAFRKLTNSLKTNNELRSQLVSQLNSETGGVLTGKIAGQQMSEVFPRGLAKYADIVGGGVAVAAHTPLLPVLGTAFATSPRLVGEFISALGWSANKSSAFINLLQKNASKSGAVANKLSGTGNSVFGVPQDSTR